MQEILIAVGVVLFVIGSAAYCVFADFSLGSSSSNPPKKVIMQPPTPPPPAPKEFTKQDIAPFTGENGTPIYIAIDGIVLDVSNGRDFYGPGAGYHVFAGKDATIGLGMMQTDASQWKKQSVEEFTIQEMEQMSHWRVRLTGKYQIIGALTDGAHPSTLQSLRERGLIK